MSKSNLELTYELAMQQYIHSSTGVAVASVILNMYDSSSFNINTMGLLNIADNSEIETIMLAFTEFLKTGEEPHHLLGAERWSSFYELYANAVQKLAEPA